MDKGALAEMADLVKRRWFRRFASKFAAKSAVKGKLVLSDIIVVSKTKTKVDKGDVTNNIKKRLILHLRKSGVTAATAKCERPELPRIMDAVFGGLELLTHHLDLSEHLCRVHVRALRQLRRRSVALGAGRGQARHAFRHSRRDLLHLLAHRVERGARARDDDVARLGLGAERWQQVCD